MLTCSTLRSTPVGPHHWQRIVPCSPSPPPFAQQPSLPLPRSPCHKFPELKFQKFTLANGLDVILHEDHATPIVGVNVWYHVGSKDERPGRTGFAHLFEHMMFQGSKHLRQGLLRADPVGGRAAERLDRHGPHQLLGDRALELPRTGPVDGIGPHGLSAPGHDAGETRQSAGRGQERAPPELREPPLRPGPRNDPGRALSARSSL